MSLSDSICSQTGKFKYSNGAQAFSVLNSKRRGHNPNRKEHSLYRCPHCGLFHLTSRKRGRKGTPKRIGLEEYMEIL